MLADRSVTWVELDYDFCSLRYGEYPCPAALGPVSSRTNILLRSQEFETVNWAKVRTTVTADASTAPDGTSTADKIVETAVMGSHYTYQEASVTAGDTHTFSVFIKAGERGFARIRVLDSATEMVGFDGVVNLSTGTITTGSFGAGSIIRSSVTDAGSGWWRASITGVVHTASSVRAYVYVQTTAATVSYTGDGVSGIYLWGAQLESGDTVSSYKYTTSAQVTEPYGGGVRKCYNTFSTCQAMQFYSKGTNTIKFIEPSYAVKGGNYIPALVKVGGYEQEVNIAGFSNKIGGLGVRAAVDVVIRDFPTRDVLTDKYWSERMSGNAQTDEAGYDPLDRSTFWNKFKSRVPNYAGRSIRVINGHYDDNGDVVADTTRHYVMDEIVGPNQRGDVTIRVKDILTLADDKKALAPRQTVGRLLADMTETATSFTLSPAGIGNLEYTVSGELTVGSEIMSFIRSGDVMTVTRGIKGTQASKHSANDTVQQAYTVDLVRGDDVIYDLLVNYGNIPASYIDFAEWQSEFDRWGAGMVLSATICKPTGVSKLIGEISQLGVTVWWDEVAQKVRIKLNHPPDELPVEWTDRKNIISITTEDNDDERATRVMLRTVQADPTKELNNDNFLRDYIAIGVAEESPDFYNGSRTQTIVTRWLNQGTNSASKIITSRLLKRYKFAPVTYNVQVDIKDDPSLTDVIELNTHLGTDVTGKIVPKLTQVYYRIDDKNGSSVNVKLQAYQFDGRYGLIAENTRNVYSLANDEEKLKGSYFAGPSLLFSDGSGAYQFS